jgi:hypothetical protein
MAAATVSDLMDGDALSLHEPEGGLILVDTCSLLSYHLDDQQSSVSDALPRDDLSAVCQLTLRADVATIIDV